MLKYLLVLAAAAAGGAADAQVYKCKGPDGKVQFSDTLCKSANASEVVPDRMPVTRQQQYEAQQRVRQMQDEAATLDQQPAAALNAVAQGRTIELVVEDGQVDALSQLLDAAAGGGAAGAIPAPAKAGLTGKDLVAFDDVKLKAALDAP